jgi:hypothetical protein
VMIPVVREPREVERYFEARNKPGNRRSRWLTT